MIKNIYISGCGGMLGEAFYNVFKKDYNIICSDKEPKDIWLDKLDFTNYEEYEKNVISSKSDLLIHLGAMTNLEECENNPKETFLNNTKSVEFAINIAKKIQIPLVFISTAGIFDGKKDLYYDEDMPNPISLYGKSKYDSEKLIEENLTNFIIARAGWMMGGGEKKDKKFVNNIINQLKEGAKELNIVDDKNGTPTYTYDFANQIKLLIENNIRGKFNVVCKGLSSRLEVAYEILKFFNLEKNIQINKVNSSFFKDKYFAKRPKSERLLNNKLDKLSLNQMRNWKECLVEYLNKDYINYLDENN
tara:strand:- start:8622 stop:9533 length:912 start_codon:yes stop_codon:yes gene_type:complete